MTDRAKVQAMRARWRERRAKKRPTTKPRTVNPDRDKLCHRAPADMPLAKRRDMHKAIMATKKSSRPGPCVRSIAGERVQHLHLREIARRRGFAMPPRGVAHAECVKRYTGIGR